MESSYDLIGATEITSGLYLLLNLTLTVAPKAHTEGTKKGGMDMMGPRSFINLIAGGLFIGNLGVAQIAIGGQRLSSVQPSDEFYKIAGEQCREGVDTVCITLMRFCEYLKDPRACFRLACAMGLRGHDEIGLKYLRLSCDGGWDEACEFIPTVNEYLRELREITKLVL